MDSSAQSIFSISSSENGNVGSNFAGLVFTSFAGLRSIHSESAQNWKNFQSGPIEEDYGWFEYQAYAFGGLVLVPEEPLATLRAIGWVVAGFVQSLK